MTDFGQLEEQQEPYDIAFNFKDKRFEISPTVEDILAFQTDVVRAREENADSNQATWARVAKLVGSKINKTTGKITGGVLAELKDLGASYVQMERVISAIHFKYTIGDDLAKAYFTTGNLGKALDSVKNGTPPSQETPKGAGETSGDA